MPDFIKEFCTETRLIVTLDETVTVPCFLPARLLFLFFKAVVLLGYNAAELLREAPRGKSSSTFDFY